ncbi:Hint domain-containing protein [Yoonia sp. R2-816]|uniref:Hint domain-containing protein n=1 Tax=Yoonia sp. R2-816 TaxID=3342638 RepID=UPI0037288057
MPFVFDWATLGSANGTSTIVDGANTTDLTVVSDPAFFFTNFAGGNLFISPGETAPVTSNITFTTPIRNGTFEILDLDSNETGFDDKVTILAFDKDGAPVPVMFSNLESYHIQDGNSVEAEGNTSTGIEGPGAPDSITVSFGGPVETISVIFEAGDSGAPTGFIGIGDISGDVVCFARGTRIMSASGDIAIEDLNLGDSVSTAQNGYQTIRWIGKRRLNAEELKKNPKLRPVRIRACALGAGLPTRDLLVSRQHRMLVSSEVAERMFGLDAILVSAIKLTGLPGVEIDEVAAEVEYIHLLFDKHEIIYAEGAPSESLFTGPQALKSVPKAARDEILSLFPELKNEDYISEPAAQIPENKRQRKLVMRLAKNNKLPLERYGLSPVSHL